MLARCCLGAARPFTIRVVFADTKQEFLRIERPYRFIFHEVTITDVFKKQVLGSVKFKLSLCSKEFSICDTSGTELYHITGPCCTWWTFYVEKSMCIAACVIHLDGTRVGEIRKKWSGFLKEMVINCTRVTLQ